ncbi:hypothetical protein HHI36_006286, partial [Cryptolaemus montrouzieri]
MDEESRPSNPKLLSDEEIGITERDEEDEEEFEIELDYILSEKCEVCAPSDLCTCPWEI